MNNRIIDLSIFNYSLKTAVFRYGAITILALSNSHINMGMLPFSSGYSFPARSVFFGLVFGLVVCTSSWVFSNYFKERLFIDSIIDFRSVLRFLFYNSIVGIVVFTILTILIVGFPFSISFYSLYLFVTLCIIIIENLLFLVYGTLISNTQLIEEVNKVEKKTILVPTGSKSYQVEIEHISFVELKHGIVIFHLKNEKIINTQFDTLEELEKQLPKKLFYRANRQFIVHRDAVQKIQKDFNRKLKVLVGSDNQDKEIIVSRYKSKELQNWLSGIL